MTFLSCLAVGLAFLVAVGLLLFVAALLGWYVPAMIERARRAADPSFPEEGDQGDPPVIDPPGPRA